MQSIIIEHLSDADQRIDKFLKKFFPHATLGNIYKWLRVGKIKVNTKKVDAIYRLGLGDTVTFFLADDDIRELRRVTSENTLPSKYDPPVLDILYEDDSIMVINKSAHMNVHPGDHKTDEGSLIEYVHDLLAGRHDSLTFRPALVHRIDRDTSGVILIAKEKRALDILLGSLQSGKIEKIYHAIVLGTPQKSRDTIREKILRKESPKDEAKVIISPDGQSAITHYNTIKSNLGHSAYSLLECRIETGRTHQIRVHLAHIGHPILGDKSYGQPRENAFARKKYTIDRQLLHASLLRFTHPISGKTIEVRAPYPQDFMLILGEENISKSQYQVFE